MYKPSGRQPNLPIEYSAGILARRVTIGTFSYSVTSTVPFSKTGILLMGANSLIRCAMLKRRHSLHCKPRISIPMGTPMGASVLGAEKPAGTTITGLPVSAARTAAFRVSFQKYKVVVSCKLGGERVTIWP